MKCNELMVGDWMITKTQMETICILVIVTNVIAAVTRMISKDWLNVLNHIVIALSWVIILKHESDNYHD